MADDLTLEVATPSGISFEIKCEWVSAPSVAGEFGVLAGHLPLLAAMKCGVLKAKSEGKEQAVAIGPGFVSASPTKVEILSDLFAHPRDIKVSEVKEELKEAEATLRAADADPESSEFAELQRDVDWAIARLDTAAEAGA
ncbi:MAG: ATP synthase F1 subunit epsilon [Deltaproteobacteria bacterium]|nr:MAG: ATP synthase F1 subunit epsilon [Deltaproteobacteria bacterium]